jgi:hypothetical protein
VVTPVLDQRRADPLEGLEIYRHAVPSSLPAGDVLHVPFPLATGALRRPGLALAR